tara:strand:- start:12 stop:1658 length:1647 start_codon:yes stop_codon:yes gene_type:complete
MTYKKEPITLILITLGLFFFFLGAKNILIVILPFFISNINWIDYSEIIQSLTYLYSFVFFLFSLLSIYFEFFKEKNIYLKIKNSSKTIFSTEDLFKEKNIFNVNKTFILIFFISALIRIYKLQFNITYDEAATYLDYVDGGITDLLYYKLPNNHIFYSVLAKVSVTIFDNSQYSLRIPSFFFGLLNIIIIYNLGKKIKDKSTGIFASFSLSCIPIIIHYDTLARGYSIKITFSLMLFYFIIKFLETFKKRFLLYAAISSALGFFTILSFLFPFVGTMIWFTYMLIQDRRIKFIPLVCWILGLSFSTSLFSFVLYTPTIILGKGVNQIIDNDYFRNSNHFSQYPDEILSYFTGLLGYFFSNSMILILFIIILILCSLFKSKKIFIFLFCQLFSALIIIVFTKSIPPSRTMIFLIPFIVIIFSSSLSIITKKIQKFKILLPLMQIGILILYIEKKSFPAMNGFPEYQKVLAFIDKTSVDKNFGTNVGLYYKSLKYYMKIKNRNYPWLVNFERDNYSNYPDFIIKKSLYKTSKRNFKTVLKAGSIEILKVK